MGLLPSDFEGATQEDIADLKEDIKEILEKSNESKQLDEKIAEKSNESKQLQAAYEDLAKENERLKKELAKEMIIKGYSNEEIAKETKLDIETIKKLRAGE